MRAAVLLAALAVVAAGCSDVTIEGPTGIVRDPAPDVSDVVLEDASNGGQPFDMWADEGEFLVVYFGYTACPDICPTTLADFRSAVRRLDEDQADAIDVAMITVDPMRDDAERLTSYLQSFFAGSHALRTEDADVLRSAADAFGADYEVVIDGDDIDVGHTAFLYAIDDAGKIQLQWPFGATSEDMANDLAYLLEGME